MYRRLPIDAGGLRRFDLIEFRNVYDRNSGRTVSDLDFRHRRFVRSGILITRNPHRRSTARNVKLVQCEVLRESVHDVC